MRIRLDLVLVLSLLALQATSASAQSEPPPCDGEFTIVRVSKIKPAGSVDGFMKAVQAQKDFYRANGVTDNQIVTARVLLRDTSTGEMSYSPDQFLSLHIRPPFEQKVPGRGDAAYDAFVKLYRDNSDILSETIACIPKHGK